MHHLFVTQARQRYPPASTYCSPREAPWLDFYETQIRWPRTHAARVISPSKMLFINCHTLQL